MQAYFLAVDFSTGIAAVLLGAAAIILIVMVAETVCAALAQKPKSKGKKPDGGSALPNDEQPAVQAAEAVEPAAVQPVETAPVEEQKKPRKKRVQTKTDGERVVYDKSFSARLITSDEEIKSDYSALKNELIKSGFQSRICWRYESFRAVKPLAAKLAIRGGGLCLFCALDPDGYPQAENISDKKTYKRTPLLCYVQGESGRQISKELIGGLAQKFQTESGEYEECDYAKLFPFEEMESLIDRGLVKVKIYRKKPRTKTKKNEPEKVEKIIVKTRIKTPRTERGKTFDKPVKRGVKKIVNLEVIYACFEEGEEATFEEIIKRVFGGKKNITYIKILGRGKADKILTVTANSFSRTAEKNILEAGGKIIRKNS